MMKRKRPYKLRVASAYFRLARKAEKAGNYASANHWHDVAERFVNQHRRDMERKEGVA